MTFNRLLIYCNGDEMYNIIFHSFSSCNKQMKNKTQTEPRKESNNASTVRHDPWQLLFNLPPSGLCDGGHYSYRKVRNGGEILRNLQWFCVSERVVE